MDFFLFIDHMKVRWHLKIVWTLPWRSWHSSWRWCERTSSITYSCMASLSKLLGLRQVGFWYSTFLCACRWVFSMDTNITTIHKSTPFLPTASSNFGLLSSRHGVFHSQTKCFYYFSSNSWQPIYLLESKQLSNILTSQVSICLHDVHQKDMAISYKKWRFRQPKSLITSSHSTLSSMLSQFLISVIQSTTEMRGCKV